MDEILKIINKMGPVRLAVMGGVTLAIIVFFIFVTSRLSSGEMALLYSGLTQQDQNAVSRELESAGIVFTFEEASGKIMTRSEDVGRARLLLAEKGIPDGGSIGYELFDKSEGFSTTRFKQDLNKLRALEGELVRTITTLKPVDTARVHLVLPTRELFSRDENSASASVFLKLHRGQSLSEEQVASIQHLIAAAVPKLDPKRVSIVDQNGNLLATGQSAADDPSLATQTFEKMRINYEMRLSRSIEDIVSNVVGFGKVRATVSADIDYDHISSTAEVYDPEGQVVRSTQALQEQDKEFDSSQSNVSVENNLPGLPGDGQGTGTLSRDLTRAEEITNFEISKTVKSHTRQGGDVKRLSIAVLVDGTYARNAETGDIDYSPRTVEEMDRITALVRSAAGFDEDRGDILEVTNMRFADADKYLEDPETTALLFGLEKDDLFRVSETIILAIVAVLVVLLVLRPMANRLVASSAEDDQEELAALTADGQAALSGPAEGGTLEQELAEDEDSEMVDLEQVQGKVKASTVKKVNEIIDNSPNEVVSVLRSWMFQDG